MQEGETLPGKGWVGDQMDADGPFSTPKPQGFCPLSATDKLPHFWLGLSFPISEMKGLG